MLMKLMRHWIWVVACMSLWGQSAEDAFRILPDQFFQNSVYQTPDYRLHLGGVLFDPLQGGGAPDQAWRATSVAETGFHLVQFFSPVRKQDLGRLKDRGFKIVKTLQPFTLIVWGPGAALPHPTDGEQVRWSGPFQPSFKVLPAFRQRQGDLPVQILTHRDEATSFLGDVTALGGTSFRSQAVDEQFRIWYGDLPGETFIAVAHLPQVYSLQLQHKPYDRGELSNQLVANNLDGMNQAVTGYQAWLTQLGLDGTGLIMACVDSGVREDHPDLAGQFLNCTGASCGGAASSGHGTHVAGIMGGTGASGVVDPNGFLRTLGVAPGAKMIEQIYTSQIIHPDGVLRLVRESFANQAYLSNNSWGLSPFAQGYDMPAMLLDMGVRDADPDTAGNQAFHYVIAIENGNGGTSTIGSPDEAKNIFHVGAHQAQEQNTNQVAEFNNIAFVSGHGPALDGRHLPLIVGPGCFVESAEPETVYRMRCGTSMAAPHVAGAVTLFTEFYRNLTQNQGGMALDPSPALVKAAFLPVAIDLEGFLDADGNVMGHRFDSKQGWGRLSLPPILQPDVPVLYFDVPTVLNNTGEVWQRLFQVSDNTKPARMMLVWTDAPGHGLGGPTTALTNDLDLEVAYGGQTHLGNVFDGSGWSAPGGVADALNNTEGVLLGPTATGNFEVSVKATNLSADAVPGEGSALDQDFAFVCYNCVELPSFTLETAVDRRDVCAPADGVFDLNINGLQGFSGAVTLSVPNIPAGLTAQFSQNPVTPDGSTVLTLSGTENLARGTYEILVQANAGALQRHLILDLFVEPDLSPAVTLQLPLDMATNQVLLPEFTWDAQASSETYVFELDDQPDFSSPILSLEQETTSLILLERLAENTVFYWRVAGRNICGQGPFSPVYSFQTRSIPPILLVDDDNNSPDVRSTYTQALDSLGLPYDIADTQNSAQEPTEFALYDAIVWFSGAAIDNVDPKAGPTEATQDLLAAYLDQGGTFFISSQSYLNDLNQIDGMFNPFMRDYLGMQSGTRDITHSEVTGTGTLFTGIATENLNPPFGNSSDGINPSPDGALAFTGDQGNGGVTHINMTYRTCYLGFSLEGLSAGTVEEVFFRWFSAMGLEIACRGMEDFLDKVPDWTVSKDLQALLTCINAIHSP